MVNKKYTSYAQIEQDLAILKLEKEINYNKIKLGFEKTKENLLPSKTVSIVSNLYETLFTGTFGSILKALIPFGIKWLLKRKEVK
uniref:DUF6327 family protein n=1 Tax=Flavobacterium sp. TaxID=239 RepID=UPI0040495103